MQPSWDQLCAHAHSASACAACPSAPHGHTSLAGSTPDEARGGGVTGGLFQLHALQKSVQFL